MHVLSNSTLVKAADLNKRQQSVPRNAGYGKETSRQGGKMSKELSKLVDGDDLKIGITGWNCRKQAPATKQNIVSAEDTSILFKRAQYWSQFTDPLTDGRSQKQEFLFRFC